MIRVDQQPCWILHRRPWRESSLLLEVFSRDHGRQGLVARGARGARSPWRGLAEPFSPLLISWSRRGEMGTATGIETCGQRQVLKARALWCGLYVNELLLKLMGREEPLPELFDIYGKTLAGLVAESAHGPKLRQFELAVLQSLGVAPDFSKDAASGDAVLAEGLYHLQPETGLVAADRPGRDVFPGCAALVLAGQHPWDRMASRHARDLMRVLIDHQLDGKPLKTRDLFNGTTRLASAPASGPAMVSAVVPASEPGEP